MMEKDDLTRDDMLGKLLGATPLESPSDSFVDDVMAGIRKSPALAPARKPFFLFLKNSWPYALLTAIVIFVLMSSDLPFSYMIPGRGYFTSTLLPIFTSLFSTLKSASGEPKSISILLMVVIASGLLLILDRLVFRKPKMQGLML